MNDINWDSSFQRGLTHIKDTKGIREELSTSGDKKSILNSRKYKYNIRSRLNSHKYKLTTTNFPFFLLQFVPSCVYDEICGSKLGPSTIWRVLDTCSLYGNEIKMIFCSKTGLEILTFLTPLQWLLIHYLRTLSESFCFSKMLLEIFSEIRICESLARHQIISELYLIIVKYCPEALRYC